MELIAFDEKCSGCRACRLVCGLVNFQEVNPSKAALGIEGKFPAPGIFHINLCTQCGACAEACPEDAIKLERGAYLIDPDLCIGCMMCVDACPEDVMFVHPDCETPIKCTLCGACARICPREAIVLQEGEA